MTDTGDFYRGLVRTLLLSRAGHLAAVVVGAWISGWSAAMGQPIRAVLAALIVIGGAIPLFRLAAYKAHR